jgi:cytochrome P450
MWGKGVFSTGLDEHRKYRKIMMPAFSTANLREMIPLFYDVAQKVCPFARCMDKGSDFSDRLEMVSSLLMLLLLPRR